MVDYVLKAGDGKLTPLTVVREENGMIVLSASEPNTLVVSVKDYFQWVKEILSAEEAGFWETVDMVAILYAGGKDLRLHVGDDAEDQCKALFDYVQRMLKKATPEDPISGDADLTLDDIKNMIGLAERDEYTMEDYDNALLALIAEHQPVKFRDIHPRLEQVAYKIDPKASAYRMADRRLQALRKRGLIAFDSKEGWSVVTLGYSD